MRRQRRGTSSGHEFGGSGEDSFVAVVVTKLTGALLFILLLTMVIMALIPKAVDQREPEADSSAATTKVKIVTPSVLPEAIAGRAYQLAFATSGGRGELKWMIEGELPDGFEFDEESGILKGMAKKGTSTPLTLQLRVSDAYTSDSQAVQMVVYESNQPLTTPSHWKPGIPPIPWRSWADHGYGFVVIGLVQLMGLNAIAGVQRDRTDGRLRFLCYRVIIWLAGLSSMIGLALWLSNSRAG